jgi:KUP system potassium uptake protein
MTLMDDPSGTFTLEELNAAFADLKALAVTGGFLAVDLVFFGANSVKLAQGGWFPLVTAGLIALIFTTWKKGQEILSTLQREGSLPLTDFVRQISQERITRVPGVAVFEHVVDCHNARVG